MSAATPSPRSIPEAWPFQGPPTRIVFKLGSNLLSRPDGSLDEALIAAFARQCAVLIHKGCEPIVVTSGAVAAGMAALELADRPTTLPELQSLAAIGQTRLMAAWSAAFADHGIKVGQVLLTRGDLEDRRRYLNARYTLERLLDIGVVPVVNENDTVATEELTFGDNDLLSAIIASTLDADVLAILTDIDGLFSDHPTRNAAAQLIPVVDRVTDDIEALASGPGSKYGKGGMITKVRAARHANGFGIAAVIVNGRTEHIVEAVRGGDFRGTLFLPERSRKGARGRVRWISSRSVRGHLAIDEGARSALVGGGRSLLSVGVTDVGGEFEKGDVVSIRTGDGEEIARGIASFSSEQVAAIKGRRAKDIPALLGERPGYEEVVHRDNLHLVTKRGE